MPNAVSSRPSASQASAQTAEPPSRPTARTAAAAVRGCARRGAPRPPCSGGRRAAMSSSSVLAAAVSTRHGANTAHAERLEHARARAAHLPSAAVRGCTDAWVRGSGDSGPPGPHSAAASGLGLQRRAPADSPRPSPPPTGRARTARRARAPPPPPSPAPCRAYTCLAVAAQRQLPQRRRHLHAMSQRAPLATIVRLKWFPVASPRLLVPSPPPALGLRREMPLCHVPCVINAARGSTGQ